MHKIAIISTALVLAVLFAIPAKAGYVRVFEDEKGDVIDLWTNNTVSKAGTDIKKLKYYQYNSGKVAVSLEVYGKIDPSTWYTIYLCTTEGDEKADYQITYIPSGNLRESFEKAREELPEELEGVAAIEDGVVVEKGDINKTLDHKTEIIKTGEDGDTLRITFDLVSPKESLESIDVMTVGFEWYELGGTSEWFPHYVDFLNCTVEQNQSHQTNSGKQNQPSNNENQRSNRGGLGTGAIIMLPAVLVVLLILVVLLVLRSKKKL